uniref:Uncharacterized protein n=1 Tax=Nelumbo nucifera TaxID=4432 RepID=A0A822YH62_NELNU|nr:TPA_asm: hypothetical protein HUJ06_009176 [Nelumbo nucifera]
MLPAPLSTNLQDPSLLYFHLHFFLLQSWKISLEYVCFGGFLPIDAGIDEGKGFSSRIGHRAEGCAEREALEGVPNIQRKWVEDVALLLRRSPKMLEMSDILLWCSCL